MAPAQVIEVKDLPPEVLDTAAPAGASTVSASAEGQPVASETTAVAMGPGATAAPAPNAPVPMWTFDLQHEAKALLDAGQHDVWDALSRQFETCLIQTALANTRGRRIEAAQKLGIGRNTITRKIQELGLE